MNNIFTLDNEQLTLRLYIQPGASRDEVIGLHGDPVRLKVKIKSPPVEGKANKALITFIAKLLSIKKSQVHLLRGDHSRQKDLLIEDATDEIVNKLKSLV